MTPEIPALLKRYCTLEEKHEDYGPWAKAREGQYRELEKYLTENEYELIERDNEDDRTFHIKDTVRTLSGIFTYWKMGDKWEFWIHLEAL